MGTAASAWDQKNRQNRQAGRGSFEPAQWADVDAGVLLRAVAAVAEYGGAIRFGYTRDGGAFAIGIYGDGPPRTVYLRPSDDVVGWLERLADDAKDFRPNPLRESAPRASSDVGEPASATSRPSSRARGQHRFR